jgi:two-component system, NtrC family, sensor kinase
VLLVVFGAWELFENQFFRDADYVTLHYLYITRGIASSAALAFWAAWFVWRERRASEEDLRRSHERYRGLLEANPGAVVLYDKSLSILEWNASAERLYGLPRAAVIGKPLPTVPEAKKQELQDYLERVNRGETVLAVETTRLGHDGQAFPVQLSLLPYSEPGGALYFLEVTLDIRDQVRWRERMLQIEKLTSMGKMAAGTAHHLNSPLAALLLRVQMMREAPARAPAEDLEKIEHGLVFCQHFVRQLLEFTRASPAQKRAHGLGVLLESVTSFFNPVVQAKGAALHLDVKAAGGLQVVADRNQLETVLLILLSNALDAVDSGVGRIEVTAAPIEPQRVRIVVSDNGAGISPANLEHVFEPFFTTKEPGKGTGLGLAIARNILLEYAGSIDIDSVLRQGTKVSIVLPLAGEPLAALAPSADEVASGAV